MQTPDRKRWKLTGTRSQLALKISGVLLFFMLLSVLIVACGSNTSTASVNLGAPPVTVTIDLGNNNNTSPTPPLSPYWCGAWATDTSPIFNAASAVGIYAKFTQNVNGNPVGISGASATASITWPDGSVTTQGAITTSDGLAVFFVPIVNRTDAVNHLTFVTVSFQKDGIPPCNVTADRAAFFTLIVVSPTPGKGTPGSQQTKTPGH